MCAKFLSDNLMASNRFHEKQDGSDVPREETDHGNGEQDDLDRMRRREEAKTRQKVKKRDLAETRRQKQDMEAMLREVTEELRHESSQLTAALATLQDVQGAMESIPDAFTEDQLKSVKQTLRRAQVEIAKANKVRPKAEHADPPADIRAYSVRQLTKMGLALTWPLILALTVIGGGLIGVLYLLFSL